VTIRYVRPRSPQRFMSLGNSLPQNGNYLAIAPGRGILRAVRPFVDHTGHSGPSRTFAKFTKFTKFTVGVSASVISSRSRLNCQRMGIRDMFIKFTKFTAHGRDRFMRRKLPRRADSAVRPSLACYNMDISGGGCYSHNWCTALTPAPPLQKSAISRPHGPSSSRIPSKGYRGGLQVRIGR
jgi:hypothetical protein